MKYMHISINSVSQKWTRVFQMHWGQNSAKNCCIRTFKMSCLCLRFWSGGWSEERTEPQSHKTFHSSWLSRDGAQSRRLHMGRKRAGSDRGGKMCLLHRFLTTDAAHQERNVCVIRNILKRCFPVSASYSKSLTGGNTEEVWEWGRDAS